MAKAAALYLHPTFASVRHGGEDGAPVKIERIERVIVDPRDRDRKAISPDFLTLSSTEGVGGGLALIVGV
jgi:hypothetical protein